MKKLYHFLLAIALLLAMLVAFGVLSAQAETAEGYELKITSPDGVGYDKVYLSVSGAPAKEVELGKTYIIPKSASIKITVQPKMGYALKGMYDPNGDNVITNSGDTVYSTPSLTSDASFEIVCEPREYDIYYNGAADGYQVIGSPTKHTFGTETVLENPVKNGYTFLHWERGTDKNTLPGQGEKLGKRESDGKTVLGTSVYADGDTIYLIPVFVPNQYPVYCFDYVYNPTLPNFQGDHLGHYEAWYVDMDSIVTGKDIPAPKSYAGYYFDATNELYYTTCQVKVAEDGQLINVIVRLYLPITYELDFGVQLGDRAPDLDATPSFVGGATAPTAHIYNQSTVIPDAIREGYRFGGWTVQILCDGAWVTVDAHHLKYNEDGYLILPERTEALASEENEGKFVIRVIANMIPEQFHINYNWSDVDSSEIVFDESAYGIYTYDGVLEIPNPVRAGYRFLGWTLVCGGESEEINAVDGKTVIDGLYLSDFTLTARWETKTYEVVLDGNGADDGYVGGTFGAIYHQPFSPAHVEIPTRKGYTFLGFFSDLTTEGLTPWIDAEGNPTNQIWNLDSDEFLENGRYRVTLVARWEINEYDVTVTLNPSRDFVEIYLDGTRYEGEAQRFVYGDTVEIVIKVKDKLFKLTAINGEQVEASTEDAEGRTYTVSYTVSTSNEIVLTVLPLIDASGVRVQFATETLILPMGSYEITCNGERFSVVVNENGRYFISRGGQAAVESDRFSIPDSFFGHTMTVLMRGVSQVNADHERSFVLAARAPAPERGNVDGQGYTINAILASNNTIIIQMWQPTVGYFEYACAIKGTPEKDLQWFALDTDENGKLLLSGLAFGTDYEIYIRVKAVEADETKAGSPHGVSFGPSEVRTGHVVYVDDVCNALDQRRTGGEMVDALIDATKTQIRAIDEFHPTIQTEIESILNAFEEKLPLASKQDDVIAALGLKYAELVATKQFDAKGEAALAEIVRETAQQIRDIEAQSGLTDMAAMLEQIDLYFREALRLMGNVPIAHLYSKDHQLTASMGLLQGSRWSVLMSDYESVVEAVENAIRTGNVAMDGNGINRSALETMVVRAYYTMTLELPYNAYPESGAYRIRLHLPEELRESTLGMQVAYYNEATGELIVLDTQRDGEYLIFESTRSGIASFVILCDEEMNLSGLMLGLSLTLLAQLLAIVYLLVRRSKAVRMKRHYSVALAPALAIHFLPTNALAITVALGVLVVVAQIVLTVLLLSTHVTYRYKDGSTPDENLEARAKRRRAYTVSEEVLPESEEQTETAEAIAYEPMEDVTAESEPLLVGLTDEDLHEEALYGELPETDDEDDALATFVWDEEQSETDVQTVETACTEEEDPFGFFETVPEETYYPAEQDFEENASQDLEKSFTADEATEASAWEWSESLPVEEESEEAVEEVDLPTEESALWEPDELAPDAEEEFLYEDDYITGDPSEPVPYEDDVSGDPNPYEDDSEEKR